MQENSHPCCIFANFPLLPAGKFKNGQIPMSYLSLRLLKLNFVLENSKGAEPFATKERRKYLELAKITLCIIR